MDYNLPTMTKKVDMQARIETYAQHTGKNGFSIITPGYAIDGKFISSNTTEGKNTIAELRAKGELDEAHFAYETATGDIIDENRLKEFMTQMAKADPELTGYAQELANIRNEESGLQEGDNDYQTANNILASVIAPTSDKYTADRITKSLSVTGGANKYGYGNGARNTTFQAIEKDIIDSAEKNNSLGLNSIDDVVSDVSTVYTPTFNDVKSKLTDEELQLAIKYGYDDESVNGKNSIELSIVKAQVQKREASNQTGIYKDMPYKDRQLAIQESEDILSDHRDISIKLGKLQNDQTKAPDILTLNEQIKSNPKLRQLYGNSISDIMNAVPNTLNPKGIKPDETDTSPAAIAAQGSIYNKSKAKQMYENIFGKIKTNNNADGTLTNSQYTTLIEHLYKNKQENFEVLTYKKTVLDATTRAGLTNGMFGDVKGTGDKAKITGGNYNSYMYSYQDDEGVTRESNFTDMVKNLGGSYVTPALQSAVITGELAYPSQYGQGYTGSVAIGNDVYSFTTTTTTNNKDNHFAPVNALTLPQYDGRLSNSAIVNVSLPIKTKNGYSSSQHAVMSKAVDVYDETGNYSRRIDLYEMSASGRLIPLVDGDGNRIPISYINSWYTHTNNRNNPYSAASINQFGSQIQSTKQTRSTITRPLATTSKGA